MWFKNLKIYRLKPEWKLIAQMLESNLAPHAWHPGGSTDIQNLGWVPVHGHGGLVHVVNGQLMLAMRAEEKLLPATVINQMIRDRAQELEERQGFKPGRLQKKELKECVIDELLPRAFSVYRDTRVWIDPINRWLVIDTASSSKADEVLGLLAKSVDPFPAEPLYVAQSPAATMTAWLAADVAPENFTIDQDTELRAISDNRAAVRYVHHAIDADDAEKHIAAGKQCTKLALTWNDRVSFVLTDALGIKRVTSLDVIHEDVTYTYANDDERFDADMTLMTGELARMLDDLLVALGGEKRD